jgi:hypothetical protein
MDQGALLELVEKLLVPLLHAELHILWKIFHA